MEHVFFEKVAFLESLVNIRLHNLQVLSAVELLATPAGNYQVRIPGISQTTRQGVAVLETGTGIGLCPTRYILKLALALA